MDEHTLRATYKTADDIARTSPNSDVSALARALRSTAWAVLQLTQASVPVSKGHTSHTEPNAQPAEELLPEPDEQARERLAGVLDECGYLTADTTLDLPNLVAIAEPVIQDAASCHGPAAHAVLESRMRRLANIRELLRGTDLYSDMETTAAMVARLIGRCRDLENDRAELAGLKDAAEKIAYDFTGAHDPDPLTGIRTLLRMQQDRINLALRDLGA